MSSLDIYLRKKPRGFCLIINYYEFRFPNSTLENRDGSKVDVKKFNDIFTKLDFDMKILRGRNLKRNLIDVLNEFVQSEELINHEAIAIIIGSHGNIHGIRCSNGDLIQYTSILNVFSDDNCPNLRNKPKIILFNCCRVLTSESICKFT